MSQMNSEISFPQNFQSSVGTGCMLGLGMDLNEMILKADKSATETYKVQGVPRNMTFNK